MSDISKIKIENETYNVKDEISRQGITTLENSVNEISSQLNKKRTVLLIGDSYAEGYGNSESKGWAKTTIELLTKNNIDAFETYEGGAGFVNVGNSGNRFIDLMQNYNTTDKSIFTDIVVCGGTNDQSYSQAEIESRISDFINSAKTLYPNATVRIGMIGNNSEKSGTGRNVRYNLKTKVLQAYKNGNIYGATYLNNIEYINKNYSLFISDNVHLSDYSYIGRAVFNILMTNSLGITYPEESIIIRSTGLPGFTVRVQLNEDKLTFRTNVNRWDGGGSSFNWNTYAEVSNDVDLIYGKDTEADEEIKIPVDMTIVHSGGTSNVIGYLALKGHYLNLIVSGSYSGVSKLTVGACQITVDAINW